ncbi:hypothetical protein LR48_Vigan04g117800 [Vigna angularis]|uniref:Uncharacterized protein n=1 Tax=Phaseolus angularis TaxID=3914 RepID=A0A0L9UDJ9_PHAAN|nr:hypothetical protein LR48_Vigan04g117800 [Vigna angularis]
MTSSSGKRVKTLGNKDKGTKRKEKEKFYSIKFRTAAHERYFPTVEGRRLLMEQKVANIPSLAPQFERELNNRDGGHLATYPSPANISIIKEFYTNAKSLGEEQERPRVAWPADLALEGGRAEAAEASAMDEDAKDEDDEDEEAEEEEDSDDDE